MNAREYSLAEVFELWAAVESRRQAENGDSALLVERLRAGRATQHELDDQALLAGLIGGRKKKRGSKADPSLEAKQRQAAFFFHVLTKVISLEDKVARGRLADFFTKSDDTIRDWIGDYRKRVGEGPERVAADIEAFDFWRTALMAEKRIAELLKAAE